MIISPWACLAATIPVLIAGEFIVRKFRVLATFAIPPAVVGGLLVSGLILVLNLRHPGLLTIPTKIDAPWWSWIISADPEWLAKPHTLIGLTQPLIVAFFTCVGLNVSWSMARQGSWKLALFLVLETILSALQNLLGVGAARLQGQPALLGVACGALALAGGHGTTAGFAADFEKAGYPQAAAVGAAAATFGIVAGSLLGGPLATLIIRLHKLAPNLGAASDIALSSPPTDSASAPPPAPDLVLPPAPKSLAFCRLFSDVYSISALRQTALYHVLILLFCVKAGAYVSLLLRTAGLTFPIHIGAMTVGILVRNLLDLVSPRKPLISTPLISRLASVLLAIFLAFTMITLPLSDLKNAVPMLVILVLQVFLMLVFAYLVTFMLLGRDYTAAVISAGHVGFGLGVTSNAVASMDSITRRFGPAPQAVLVVVIVGAYLGDFTNALNITWFLNWFK